MAEKTGISWTDSTWNAATGCTEVSAGCDLCYARLLAERLQRMGQARYANGFIYTEHPQVISLPRTWREPRRVFVNSMSDVFHEKATKPFVWALFDMMIEVNRHTYQVLTKRPAKMASWMRQYCAEHKLDCLPPHIWCGTSTEDQVAADLRIPHLLRVPASVRFLSCEPLIGSIDLRRWVFHKGNGLLGGGCLNIECAPGCSYGHLHWVITGGESGHGYRPMESAWARQIRDDCAAAGVAYFHKQDSGLKPGQRPELDGRLHHDFPQRPVLQAALL